MQRGSHASIVFGAAFQDEVEVAKARVMSVSVDPPPVSAAFRACLGARWTFLSDPDRVV